jgi:hypothetical protein
LDFTTFVITGPSTYTAVQIRRNLGAITGATNDAYVEMGSSLATNCLLDHFSAQGASPSSSPPIVCGTLTSTHMYVEADEDRCNKMNFNLAGDNDAIAVTVVNTRGLASLATRSWDITITQLECTHELLPKPGCTQYFYGSLTVTVASYNYFSTLGTSVHLANQHQRICIRRERGYCIGCFYGDDTSFNISGGTNDSVVYTFVGGCCGYNTEIGGAYVNADTTGHGGAGIMMGYDCIIIPGAYAAAAAIAPLAAQTTANIQQTLKSIQTPTPIGPQICGNEKGIGYGAATLDVAGDFTDINGDANNITVCTRRTPFTLEFLSDDFEGQGTTANESEYISTTQAINNGFSLRHTQIACT